MNLADPFDPEAAIPERLGQLREPVYEDTDLRQRFECFFEGLSGQGPRYGYPRFKKKGERDSARLYAVTLEERHIRLRKIGRVRLKETRSKRGFRLDG